MLRCSPLFNMLNICLQRLRPHVGQLPREPLPPAPAPVEVALRGGARAPALIYVPTKVLEIAGEDWDFDFWRRTERDLLMTLVRGHMKLLGRVSQDEAIRVWDETRKKLQPEQAKRACRKGRGQAESPG